MRERTAAFVRVMRGDRPRAPVTVPSFISADNLGSARQSLLPHASTTLYYESGREKERKEMERKRRFRMNTVTLIDQYKVSFSPCSKCIQLQPAHCSLSRWGNTVISLGVIKTTVRLTVLFPMTMHYTGLGLEIELLCDVML